MNKRQPGGDGDGGSREPRKRHLQRPRGPSGRVRTFRLSSFQAEPWETGRPSPPTGRSPRLHSPAPRWHRAFSVRSRTAQGPLSSAPQTLGSADSGQDRASGRFLSQHLYPAPGPARGASEMRAGGRGLRAQWALCCISESALSHTADRNQESGIFGSSQREAVHSGEAQPLP